MFWERVKIKEMELEYNRLRTERQQLKEELEDLKLKKKMELKEVEHLVKMVKEKNAIEFEKK